MKISAKTDYACRALLELALHWPNPVPLQINTIAAHQKIPAKFLTQILVSLKHLGLVESVRGQKGGYILAKSPQEIKLRDVIENFEKTGFSSRQAKKNNDIFLGIWRDIEEEIWRSLDRISFEEIVKRERTLSKVPMFTI